MNYIHNTVDMECCGNMEDDELNEMVSDFIEVLHDLEWWQSCDHSEEVYRATAERFKSKWFGKRDLLLRRKVADKLRQVADGMDA